MFGMCKNSTLFCWPMMKPRDLLCRKSIRYFLPCVLACLLCRKNYVNFWRKINAYTWYKMKDLDFFQKGVIKFGMILLLGGLCMVGIMSRSVAGETNSAQVAKWKIWSSNWWTRRTNYRGRYLGTRNNKWMRDRYFGQLQVNGKGWSRTSGFFCRVCYPGNSVKKGRDAKCPVAGR